jgi:hypothetical protein
LHVKLKLGGAYQVLNDPNYDKKFVYRSFSSKRLSRFETFYGKLENGALNKIK